MTSTTYTTGGIFKGAFIGGVIAGVVNVALFFAGGVLGAEFFIVQGTAAPEAIPAFMPFASTLLQGSLGGGIAFSLINRFSSNPTKGFTIATAVALVLVTIMPILMVPEMVAMIILQLMHFVAAGFVLVNVKKFGAA